MSIATEITRLQNAKASIKTSIENKGVTVPSSTKLDGYSTLINSIQTGITPTGTISITSNGTVDVTNYASADVNVSGGGGSSFNFTGESGKLWGGMAKALVDGTYASGTVTYTTAFPNTYSTLLDTGLSSLKGICMWLKDAVYEQSGQQNNMYLIFSVNPNDNTQADMLGLSLPSETRPIDRTPTGRRIFPYTFGTISDQAGIQGGIRLNGGIIEYQARYNKNASYQIFPLNKAIEWIAW